MSSQNPADFNTLYEQWLSSNSDDTVAMYFNDREIRIGELKNQVDRYVRSLKSSGIKPGTGVGYSLPNCPEVFSLFFAVCRIGAYTIPLFPMIPDTMKASVFSSGRAAIVVTSTRQFDSLRTAAQQQDAAFKVLAIDSGDENEFTAAVPEEVDTAAVPAAPEMPAMVAASSGTTGIPKTVIMNRRNISSALQCAASMVPPAGVCSEGRGLSVIAFPLSTSGMLVCAGVLFAGVALVFSDNASPVVYLDMAGRRNAPLMAAPPSYFESILALPNINPKASAAVRGIMTGMDFFSPSLLERLKKRFPHLVYCSNGYGLVETSTVFMVMSSEFKDAGSVATASLRMAGFPANEIDIRDSDGTSLPVGTEGELWVRGPSVVMEYLGNPADTAQAFCDGWFKTGDIARKTDEKSITLLGRNKYLIKRGGKSISPIVVQNQINKVCGVKDSTVIGVPHKLYGQMIWAFVVPDAEGTGLEKEIMKACREALPNYMLPDAVRFLETIPKNPGVGKVNVEKLLAIAGGELATMQESDNG